MKRDVAYPKSASSRELDADSVHMRMASLARLDLSCIVTWHQVDRGLGHPDQKAKRKEADASLQFSHLRNPSGGFRAFPSTVGT